MPLTSFLCVYPHLEDADYIDRLWQALKNPDTVRNLALVGKSYGAGAIKVEPRALERLPIPDHVVAELSLTPTWSHVALVSN
jgi:adenine-specific DNA-methyltransferase